jgi:integrase
MNDLSKLPSVAPGKGVRDQDGLHKRRGYWHYCLTDASGRRKFYSSGEKDYQEARKAYRKAQQANDAGQLPSERAKQPFSKAAEDWIGRRMLEKLADNTVRTDRERLQPLKKHFGDTKLGKINAEHIREYQLLRSQFVGPRTVNLEVKVLRMILSAAKCWAKIRDDYKPLKESRRGPGIALTAEQLRNLIETAALKPEWDAAYLAAWIASNTTMRGGEIKKLRHQNVDLFARVVRIERDATKTDGGCREIPLNDEAVRAFARLIDRANQLGSSEPNHYLFPAFWFRHTKTGSSARGLGYDPIRHATSWRTAWRSLRKKAGIPKLRFHDLRHTAITQLAEAGVSIPIIEALAGHLSPEMTKHYTHVRDKAKVTAVAVLSVFPSAASPTVPREEVRPS